MRYNFILNNGDKYPVEKMCLCMKVSKNAYYNWFKQKDRVILETPKTRLLKRIREIFEENRQIYGSDRIQKMLEREGLKYSRSYIGLLMKEMGLKSVLRKKYVVTTDSKHSLPIANNELNRCFTTLKLGERWVSDITYIWVNDGWNYLTTIIDLADRKVIGWSLSE
jgi:transposase InsO family protein